VREDQRHLLAAVSRGYIELAGFFVHGAGNVPEHDISLLMTVGVVDRFEVVNVEHDQAQGMAMAADLLDLDAEELPEAAVRGEPGQLVGDRLTGNLNMEPVSEPTCRAIVAASP
jgi:hypothetical protein